MRHDSGTEYAAAEIQALAVNNSRGRDVPFEYLANGYVLLAMDVRKFNAEADHDPHYQSHDYVVECLFTLHGTIRVPEQQKDEDIEHRDDTRPDQGYLWNK